MNIKKKIMLCLIVSIATILCCAHEYNQIAYAGEDVEINGTTYTFDCAFLLQDLADFEDAGNDSLNSFQFQNATTGNPPFPYGFATNWEVIVEYEVDVTPFAFTVTPPGINLAIGVPDPNKITLTPDTTDTGVTEIFPSSFIGVNFVPGQAIWQEEIVGFSGRIIFDKTDQDPSIFVDTPCSSGDKIERDLSIAKTNDLGGADTQIGTAFTWSLAISSAIIGFDVPMGTTVVRDNVPADFTIGTVTSSAPAGIDCSATGSTVECVTTTDVRFPEGGTQFTVGIPVTPTTGGTYTNPDGVCAVDPDMMIAEIGEDENGAPLDPATDNNACSDTVIVAGVTLVPDVAIVKTADTTTANVGDTITYNYTVSNTGDVELTNVVVNDDQLGGITLDVTTIPVSGSATGTATYTVVGTDLPGPITNVATVTAESSEGNVNGTSAEVVVTLSGNPAVAIVKTADVATANVGDTITYNYVISNTGDLEITNLVVTDDQLGGITLDGTMIAVNGSATGSATHVVVEGDLPGPITNIATVTGDSAAGAVNGTSNEVIVTLSGSPAIEVVKSADVTTANVGDTITYSYTVNNIGDVALTDVVLSDDVLGAITLDMTTIPVDGSAMGTATHVVVEGDLPGPITNIATVSADSLVGSANDTDEVTVTLSGSPAIEVVKSADVTTANVGDTITYSYTVNNIGDVALTDVVLSDDVLGAITLDMTTIPVGGSAMGTATHVVVEGDLPGPITNVATVTADSLVGSATDTDSASVATTAMPSIVVEKTADPSAVNIGDTIIYRYTVTNTGDVQLTNVMVMDDPLGGVTLDTTVLAPGEATTGLATYLVTTADYGSPITNTAVATADYVAGTVEGNTPVISVEVIPAPSIELVKIASSQMVDAGDMITYTYIVTNTGDIPLTDITVVDDPLGGVTLDTTTLAPGESTMGMLMRLVTVDDVGQMIMNTAAVTGSYPDGIVESDVPAVGVLVNENPSLEVEILASETALGAGQTVTYTYIVRNMGDTALALNNLADDRFGEIVYLGQTLLGSVVGTVTLPPFIVAGDEVIIEIPYTVRTSDAEIITNTINAMATSPLGAEVTDMDDVSVAIASADIDKTLISAELVDVGDVITFEVVVQNTGGVDFVGMLVDDYSADGVNCMAFTDVNPSNVDIPYTVDETAKTITWDNLAIPMGESETFELIFTITERGGRYRCVNDAVYTVEPFNLEVDATTRQPTAVLFNGAEPAMVWPVMIVMVVVLVGVTALVNRRGAEVAERI